MCHKLQIEEHEVSFLKEKNGAALESLTKEDWIRRSANHGDILFNQWQKLKERHVTKKTDEDDAITDVKSGKFGPCINRNKANSYSNIYYILYTAIDYLV